ncbi:MAG: DnaA regulatory inactivator Hda [Gammaproteobacteria bacterium]|nr:DnaA regulatory inactivator Hda [Gammaproteobacteria bacterium]
MNRIASVRGQIPLAIGQKERLDFNLFLPGENSEACQKIKRIAAGTDRANIYLWGPPGSGKTHLLQAACKSAGENNCNVAYIPLAQHVDLDTQLLEGLDTMDLICMDDIDRIAGRLEWEQPLLHLYNRMRDKGCSILMVAHTSPQAIGFELKDLKSRMAWDLVYHLKPLDDYDKMNLLRLRANARAFELPKEVAEYLVKRVRRDLPSLITLLDELERATLAEQRKLTIPFVKSMLNEK